LGPTLGLPNLEGVWHTSIVVHGTEIFFGGSGIEHCIPGTTMLGQPQEKKNLGNTSIDMNSLTSHLRQIGQTEFHGTKYDLFKHNCNNFSSSLTKFLGVHDVPSHILALPDYVLSSPIAAILRPIIEQATPDGQGTSFASSPSMERNGTESTSNASNSGNVNRSQHFPPKEYCVINVPVDVDKVMGKILSFNEKYEATNRLNDEQLTKLRLLTEPGLKLDDAIIEVLELTLRQWNKEDTFPLWHLVCHNVVRNGMSSQNIASKLFTLIQSHKMLNSDSPHTRMCLRILVSFFGADISRSVIKQHREDIIGNVNSLVEDSSEEEISPQVENAVASLLFNFSKLFHEDQKDCMEAGIQLISSIVSVLLPRIKGPEANYKLIIAAATLIGIHREIQDLAEALEFSSRIRRIPKGRMANLDELINQLNQEYA